MMYHEEIEVRDAHLRLSLYRSTNQAVDVAANPPSESKETIIHVISFRVSFKHSR
jgi:hypothetical protein